VTERPALQADAFCMRRKPAQPYAGFRQRMAAEDRPVTEEGLWIRTVEAVGFGPFVFLQQIS